MHVYDCQFPLINAFISGSTWVFPVQAAGSFVYRPVCANSLVWVTIACKMVWIIQNTNILVKCMQSIREFSSVLKKCNKYVIEERCLGRYVDSTVTALISTNEYGAGAECKWKVPRSQSRRQAPPHHYYYCYYIIFLFLIFILLTVQVISCEKTNKRKNIITMSLIK